MRTFGSIDLDSHKSSSFGGWGGGLSKLVFSRES